MPKPQPETLSHWIVGIGASAGGLEALSAFVRELPRDVNAAFVIGQHLAPHSKSLMAELLSRQTELPVIAVEDRMELQTGHIYVIPPNVDATFTGNQIRLTRAGEETRPKPSVDLLLKSLAQNFGRRAVGIILSGTGTDGAEGMRAVKENGGIILSQDNLTAKYDGMPRAAQDRNLMDEILPADQLGKRLVEILTNHGLAPAVPTAEDTDMLGKILDYLRRQTNQDFTRYKRGTISRRIEKRLLFLGLSHLTEYYERIQNDAVEIAALAQEMLVSVTSFFRDPEAYEVIQPELRLMLQYKTHDRSEVRIWCAGCATGEEAYSIAMLLHELSQELKVTVPVKIFATDLDTEAVSYARAGFYSESEVGGLTPYQLQTYFDRRENGYEVKKFLKENVVFARQNLIQNPPFVKLDLITCRNVLIYFDSTLQQRVFEIFQYSLKPGGLLFLGKSEMAPSTVFETLDRKNKLFRRLNLPSTLMPFVTRNTVKEIEPLQGPSGKKTGLKNLSLDSAVPTQLLREYRLCGVVIDEDGAIYHTVGDLSRFLSFPNGLPDFRLTNLISKSASVELVVLLRKTKKSGRPQRSRAYESRKKGGRGHRFVVRRLELDQNYNKPLFLVSFEGIPKTKKVPHTPVLPSTHASTEEVIELRRELATTREHLQTLVEELEISNEELQSLNEELSSTNEELQASNEELETTNEELQASNEELVTVNEELSTKQSELKVLNLSLENIQNSIESPLVVVDSQLRVLSYNRDASKVFNISTRDLGRSIAEVSCNCVIQDFEQQIRTTLLTGKSTETHCDSQNIVYQVRIHPNRDDRNKANGAVIVFFNNTDVIRAKEKLRLSDANTRSIIDGTPALISLKDLLGKYVTVNAAFLKRFGLREEEVIGKTDRELFHHDQANLSRDRDLEMFLRRESVEYQETIHFNGTAHTFFTTRFPLQPDSTGAPQLVGTVSVDVTPQIRAQSELQKSEARYRAIIEDQAVLVCRHRPDGRLTFTNAAFCAFLGGTPEINLTRSYFSFLESGEIARIQRDLKTVTADRNVIQTEVQIRTPHSGLKWVRWIHRALFDEHGEISEFQAVGFDVTEMHHQTSYLLQKETLFTHVLEHTSDYLTVYKVDGKHFVLESFNPSAAKTRTQGHHRLIGQRLEQVDDSTNTPLLLRKYRECADTQQVVTFEEEVQSPRGSIFLLTTLVPILSQDYQTERVAALSRDITHLKRVENALREQKRTADLANRAKSDFLAAMSHELRTPLGVISGMTQLLGRDVANPNQKKYISTIQQSTRNLLTLIEDILDVSKIEAGKLVLEEQPFELDVMLDEVEQTFESAARLKGLEFRTTHRQKERLRLIGDQKRIRQVLINLLGNAIKFTEKGMVEISVESTESESAEYQRIHVEVRDSGVGIPAESFSRIFSRFSQADSGISRKYGGSGLGLAISKQLVELMDGQIGFESKEGAGSVFWFTLDLPIAKETDALPRDNDQSEEYDLSDATVLVVDDNFDSLQLMELFLRDRVKKLYTTQDPQEAVQLVEHEPIDVVVMDIQMPIMDGMETTRAIRGLEVSRRNLPVIAVTANAMAGDRERFLAAGLNDYISKPVDFQRLYQKIHQWAKEPHVEHPNR
jgi:two-component system CheB/CheR fusion protein